MEKTTEIQSAVPTPAIERPVPGRDGVKRLERLQKAHGATWDGPQDPNDPYNWTSTRKNTIAILYSLGSLVTLMSAAMIAPVLKDITHDLKTDASTAQIVFSAVFLGYGFGPFIIAAFSEMHGRRMIWIYSQVFYVVWNALSPVGSNKVLMIIGRFMAGLGASAGIALVGPVMADMYGKAERGQSLAIASFLPYLGPALGPIIGGVVTELVSWNWVFWIMSLLSAILAISSVFFVRETYTPALLRRKASLAQYTHPPGTSPTSPVSPPLSAENFPPFKVRLITNLLRPFKLIIQRPIIQVLSFALGLNFGVYSFLLSSYATLFQSSRYGQDRAQASLHYFSITVAATIVSVVGTRVMDWIYDALCRRHKAKATRDGSRGNDNTREESNNNNNLDSGHDSDCSTAIKVNDLPEQKNWHEISLELNSGEEQEEEGIPEYRAPYMVPAVILVAVGIFTYGWAAEKGLHWIVVDIGACILNVGGFALAQGVLAYQLDEFGDYAASAGAASRLLSYLMGFGFPIFVPGLYKALGYGWGNSVVGLVWIVLGMPVPVILWVWGAKLRGVYWGTGKGDDVTR